MNKGSSNIKTVIVVIVLILVGVLGVLGINTAKTFMSSAAGGCEPKGVKATVAEDGKSAVVSWETDKECLSLVKYGTTPAGLLLTATEQSESSSHRLSLSPLKKGVTYYYHIEVGEEVYEDTDGIPYNFKTGDKKEELPKNSPSPALLPTGTNSGISGTCDRKTDYNKDGKVNSFDYLDCNSKQDKIPTTKVSLISASPSKPAAIGSDNCENIGDYDKNGIVNSVDKIKCLQSTKH